MYHLSVTRQFRPFPVVSCSFNPRKPPKTQPPARDLVIDFGKYKGKMLGTLPSAYLKWVSNNLRARDYERWANLADEVLRDPVYNDRIEWEFADKILRGTTANNIKERADDSLFEISERFGWDNDDKSGWRKVNFELLGTSSGGRIPRKKASSAANYDKEGVREEIGRREKARVLSESEERRRLRRMRLKKRAGEEDKLGIIENKNGIMGNGVVDGDDKDRTVEIQNNRFPGREGLVKKVLRGRKILVVFITDKAHF